MIPVILAVFHCLLVVFQTHSRNRVETIFMAMQDHPIPSVMARDSETLTGKVMKGVEVTGENDGEMEGK